jgi:hypothetical protein
MASRTNVGRNDACPCGSGRKYKRCCGPKQEAWASNHRLLAALLIAALLGAAAAAVSSFRTEPPSAPPGKVWSPEHGHYH